MLKKVICVAGICVLLLGAVGGFLSADTFLHGEYHTADNGYYLIRDDVNKTYAVRLPAETTVPTGAAVKSTDSPAALETVELTYQYSYPGKTDSNWDIYTDQDGNRYTYKETTGQLVSISYFSDSKNTEKGNRSAYEKSDIIHFSERYLKAIVPDFSHYVLESYEAWEVEENAYMANQYSVTYAVPIGEYFFGDQIHLGYDGKGVLTGVTFSQTDPIELSEEEERALIAKLPSRDEFYQMAQDYLKETYPAPFCGMEQSSNPILVKTTAGYTLRGSFALIAEDGCKVLESYSYDISL